ncbi:MAG: hypothetical protein COB23_08110 [Methylophaga sp.]|nr:MAG: hypothetical protein COB23_08110 [Methylophaga sp.]
MRHPRINKYSYLYHVKHLILLLFLLAICACSPVYDAQSSIKPIRNVDKLQDLVDNINTPFVYYPSPNHYSVCHGHTCNKFAFISLSAQQWQSVTHLFSPVAKNAQQERQQIQLAIALLETLTGEQSNTNRDRAENYVSEGLDGQLDCIDEATNSTVYLRILYDAGLLNFHQQASRTSRGGLLSPHNTATIIDKDSGHRYAVDSWFGDNGEPPAIVPLPQWKKGWKPKRQ